MPHSQMFIRGDNPAAIAAASSPLLPPARFHDCWCDQIAAIGLKAPVKASSISFAKQNRAPDSLSQSNDGAASGQERIFKVVDNYCEFAFLL